MIAIEPGHVVADKYEIERVLGQGGMGTVFSAVHRQLRERVAIKLLSKEATAQSEALSRFMREARAAARIKSEHVAKVSDVGTLPDATPYIVMEYLEGADLSDVLAQRGPLPVDDAVELVLQACEAIAEAHSLGIVHRDLKPANLYLTHRADGTPCIKVLDFGISKVTHPGTSQEEAALTHTTSIMGSPLYMSPEQLRATRGVDLRTDIWSLGVILYELLAGEAPFLGPTLPDISVKIAVEPPPPLRAKRPDLSVLLEAVILKCLEKDRDNRFRTLGELALAMIDFAPPRARVSIDRVCGVINAVGVPESVLPSGVAPSGQKIITGARSTDGSRKVITGESSAETVSTFGTTASQGRSRRAAFVVAAVVVVVAAAAAAVVAMRSAGQGDPTPAAPPVDVTQPVPPKPEAPAPVVDPAPAPVVDPAPAPPKASVEPAPPTTARTGRTSRPRPPPKTEPQKQPSASPAPAPAPSPPALPPTNLLDNRK